MLLSAMLADRHFVAENERLVVLEKDSFYKEQYSDLSDAQRSERLKYQDLLKVPRRPPWTADMAKEDLIEAENAAFLEWRRSLAQMEENQNLLMTPFERNLDIWRQLWRVVERSELVVQIVDSRNPLLFRCADLERYVRELSASKRNLLLLNKADLLTPAQRAAWSTYLSEHGIRHVFWSAVNAQAILDEEAKVERERDQRLAELLEGVGGDESNDEEEEEEEETASDNDNDVDSEKQSDNAAPAAAAAAAYKGDDNDGATALEAALSLVNTPRLATREQLLSLLTHDCPESQWKGVPDARRVVGFVGYPNVGKSSTINVLMGEKKTGVTSTPGKTKHFQTLLLNDELMACDCPGLVLPSFVMSKADMYLNGLLPIDRMRQPGPAVDLLCRRIGRARLEKHYNVVLPAPREDEDPNRAPRSSELLQAYGFSRGYTTGRGVPDEARSARYVLKDYVSGTLLHVNTPPTLAQWSDEQLVGGRAERVPLLSNQQPTIMGAAKPAATAGAKKPTYVATTLEEFQDFQGNVQAYSKSRKSKNKRKPFVRKTK